MILLIDNYDSFAYNLYQYIGTFTDDVQVVRNDKLTVEDVKALHPEKIVLSPGPKTPNDAGICLDLVREFYDKVPMLGVCLGHQTIGAALGGHVIHAANLLHGKQSVIEHAGEGIFSGVPSPIKVARYHSLSLEKETLPECFEILAYADDGEIMAMRHREYPVVGLQFHPESIYTQYGKRMVENFVNNEV